jgi:SHS2 domain-containing protein
MASAKRYEFFPHTADAKFRAYGKTIEKQFSNAALAMFSIFVDTDKIAAKTKHTLKVESNDEKGLLYSWLEELLFLVDTKEFMLHKVEKLTIEKNKINGKERLILNAEVSGDKYKKKYELLGGGVKAATYNEMEITKEYVQAVVDV